MLNYLSLQSAIDKLKQLSTMVAETFPIIPWTYKGFQICLGLIFLTSFIFYFFNGTYKLQIQIFQNKTPECAAAAIDDSDFESKLIYELKFRNVSVVEKRLFARLKSIKKSCGQVCDTTIRGIQGKFYEKIIKKFECDSFFTNHDIDLPSEFETPPQQIPSTLLPEYTYGGKLRVISEYRDETNGKFHDIHWTVNDIEEKTSQFKAGTLEGLYGLEIVNNISQFIDNFVDVKDKTVLVVGSQSPWLESILLVKGAKEITTFDYVSIKSDHPQIETITPDGLSRKFFDGKRYDVMFTYSSLEHSGLGRYGDQLNPWGDLITMARSWCLVKPKGKALVGVPSGPDIIGFNSHKIYGPIMYAQLFANWEVLQTDTDFNNFKEASIAGYQSLHALSRIDV